jgi:hypothetical protein
MIISFRVLKYFFCFFTSAILFLPKDGLTQRGLGGGMLLGRGPQTIGLQYDYFEISETHQISLQISRGMDMGFMRMSMMALMGGIRFGAGDSTEFRWRVGLFDTDMIRKFFSVGWTIVDYNKAGMLERDFTYVNLRLGPALRLGNPRFSAIAQVAGSIGGSEIILGETNYPGSGLDKDKKLSGFEAGYKSMLSLVMRRFTVSADYGERIIGDTPEPHFKTLGVGAQVRFGGERIGGGVILFLRFERQEFLLSENGFAQTGKRISLGLRILPTPPERPDDFPEE